MNASPLAAAAIRALLADSASHVAIEVVGETGSTNADLLARLPLAGPVLRVAEQQSAGRGRAGRSWLSAPGASLTFSLAWPFRAPLQRMVGLPLAVGVALAETLNGLGVPVQLKWPNDLLKDGAKLAGILVETQAAPDGTIWAVIGCGINLLMPDALEEAIGREVSSAPWLAQMERNALLAQLLSRLCAVLAEFDGTGFAAFAERWNALQAWHGQPVRLLDQGQVQQEGLAAGVDAQGRLLLDTPAGRVAVGRRFAEARAMSYALLIDAGNTRIKWALAAPGAALGDWQAQGAHLHADAADFPAALAAALTGAVRVPALTRVLIANVAGHAVRDLLTGWLAMPVLQRAIAPQSIEWFASVPQRAGVRNAYRNPAQLGCDRFAAAIGAHALCPGKAIVVANCGTATTIDAITADGTFLGGMILPGLGLMATSLARNTAQLPHIKPGSKLPEGFADNTDDAILTGCLAAQAGAIERAFALHQAVECIISGGAAPYVAPAVPVPHRHVENIVMIGLHAALRSA